MANQLKKIAVFCGSSKGNNALYSEACVLLARCLVSNDIALVYGGGNVGLMGVLADSVLELGGQAIGVIPESLVDVELAHQNLTQLHIVKSMHERKALMESLADGFILMPGGSGSLDEFFEMFTWCQLGYHRKPCGIYNVNDYYAKLLDFITHAVEQGFLQLTYQDMLQVSQSPQELLQHMTSYVPPAKPKWVKG